MTPKPAHSLLDFSGCHQYDAYFLLESFGISDDIVDSHGIFGSIADLVIGELMSREDLDGI